MAGIDQIKQDVIDVVLAAGLDVRAVYIYGSFASGTETEKSDVDIALRCHDKIHFRTRIDLNTSLEIKLKRRVDLLDMTSVSTVMRMQVVSKGQRIFCTDFNEAEDYDDLIFVRYARLNEERAGIVKDIQARGSIYG